jgi:uncharacterized protein (TIRG00374 family)
MAALQLVLGVIALAALVWRVDLGSALQRLPRVELAWALPGLLLFTLSKALHAQRWRHMLRRRRLAWRPLFGLFLVSNLVNALFPFRAGDLLRIELPSRRFGLPRAELAATVLVVESLLDGVAFVLLLAVGLLFVDLPRELQLPLFAVASTVLALFAVSAGAARAGRRWDAERVRRLLRLPRDGGERVARVVNEAFVGMAALSTRRDLAVAVALSIGAWLVEVVMYWMMAQAFDVRLSFGEALFVTVAANLIVAVPITPWDIGPYELAVTETLSLIGVERGTASSYAVGSHVLLLAWIGITGALAMWTLQLRPRDVLHPGASPQPESADH